MKIALVILGPTATGKTELGLKLSREFNGEIVSCDSRQIYRGLDVGTGKITNNQLPIIKSNSFWEVGGVRVWMYDVADPKTQYTVADYLKDAREVVEDIHKRGKLPIVVGGTGLYLKALLEGLSNLEISVDLNLRNKLQKLSTNGLQKKLRQLSPQRWNRLNQSDKQNPRRLVRAIELTVGKKSKVNKITPGISNQFDILKIGLTAPRKILYQKADKKVIERINRGIIDETKMAHKGGLYFNRMEQLGLEYSVLSGYLQGKIKEDQLIRIMQNKVHGFIKRQLTWFKKEKEINWFNIGEDDFSQKIEKKVREWYYLHHDSQS